MDSVAVVADERAPLLPSSTAADDDDDDEIRPWRSDHPSPPPLPVANGAPLQLPKNPEPSQRLASLDVFRGLTVALMILVDDAGGAFPSINHAPWFGVTLADFVMPFFLFIVGVSVALVFKKTSNKVTATKKVIMRTLKLFLLGLLLQGGYFHGRDHLTYGVDINHIRWLGILQRISIGYFLAAMSEIWLISNMLVDSPVSYVKKYYFEGIVAVVLTLVYVGLLFGLYVPDWEFAVPSSNSTLLSPTYGVEIESVQCGVRGSLGPPCNAVGLTDRFLLGEKHLYQNPVYKRTKECSVNSPDYGPLPLNSPGWCLAPFDPEGLLSSLMAAVTCFAGLHFGHIIVHFKGHSQRMLFWSMTSLVLILCGFIVELVGMPFSKPLYTLSYLFLTTGVSGILLTLIYYIVDMKQFRRPFMLLQWMGMNALIVYVLAASELFPAAVQGFYWRSPENNLVDLTESLLQTICHSKSKASVDSREPVNEQAIANMYAAMRSEMNQLYSKITELEMEVSEHSLVIGAIQPLDPSRRCYRMIGGVLVDRTIKEVLPAVQRNKAGLEEVIARLNEALEKKKKEIAEFELQHKIKIRRADTEAQDDGNRKEGSAQGVLVGPANE